ncbi:MAG: hypothetical protein OXC41_07440 [Gammaproteobacteria bacterium]|nr:hypothetical protein [Gammaproteobacteria bacterium]
MHAHPERQQVGEVSSVRPVSWHVPRIAYGMSQDDSARGAAIRYQFDGRPPTCSRSVSACSSGRQSGKHARDEHVM